MADAISKRSPGAAGALAHNGAGPAGDPLTLAGRTLHSLRVEIDRAMLRQK